MTEKTSWQIRLAAAKRPLLISILSLYLLLTLGYGIVNPLFEAPDEHHHFFTAAYIATNGRLPTADPQDKWLRQEAAQPPLYYLLGALLVKPIDTSQAQSQLWRNPQASLGDASALTNINWAVHTANEAFPWQGYALAAHLLRMMSTLLGLGTLLCIYGCGRLLWPQQPELALLAVALTAFLPQFNFLHSTITNDTFIIFLGTAALWQLVGLWQKGATNGRLLILGITVGLAILSKNAGTLLLLYVPGIISLLWLKDFQAVAQTYAEQDSSKRGEKRHNLQSLIFNLLWVLIPALLISGWLWWRNWQLYGDITATNIFIEFAGGNRHASLLQVLGEWQSLWPSLFAVFGWFNLRPPPWVYWVWTGIVITAFAGFMYGLIKNKDQRLKMATDFNFQSLIFNIQQPWFIAVWLAGWVFAVYAGLVMFMLKTEAAQGRLLFPAILPLALALAYGLSRFRWQVVFWLAPLFAFGTSLACLFFVIRPAYALPPVLDSLPPEAVPLRVDLGQGLQLVGADIETETAVPGDPIWLTLYWQAAAPLTTPPEFTVEILGQELTRIGQAQGYHGRGLYPANLWPQQKIIADRFAVRLEDGIKTPVWATAYAGLVGEESRAAVGNIEIEPGNWPASKAPALANLGDGIELTAVSFTPETASAGDVVTVSLQWRVTAAPGQNYTTLVHLAQAGQPPLATGDNQPLNGRYPTSLWEAGELIDDSYTFVVPGDVANGRYPIWIGLYNAETFARLPLRVNGAQQANDVYQAGFLDISN